MGAPFLRRGPTPVPGLGHALVRALADNIEPCVYVQDSAGRLVFVNRSFVRWLGLAETDLLGKVAADVWPADIAERDEADLALVFAGARLEGEDERPRASGAAPARCPVRALKLPLCDEHGSVVAALTLFHSLRDDRARLPVHRPDGEGIGDAAPTPPAPAAGEEPALKVLVVESDPQVRRLTQLVLERAHYEVIPAADLAAARAVLDREACRPDLVVLDEGHVDELDDVLALAPGALRVLTCAVGPADLAKGPRAHFAGLLLKPYDADELVQAIWAARARSCGWAFDTPATMARGAQPSRMTHDS
jgi:CheY-like chemotaxis protein